MSFALSTCEAEMKMTPRKNLGNEISVKFLMFEFVCGKPGSWAFICMWKAWNLDLKVCYLRLVYGIRREVKVKMMKGRKHREERNIYIDGLNLG